MEAFAVPIKPGKVETWKSWVGELTGSRQADFDELNARMGLTMHAAWLQENPDGSPLVVVVKDAVMRQKIAQLWIDTECLKYTGARAITRLLRGEMPGPEASTGKMGWVETHQKLQELAMEIEGPYAQLMPGSDWTVEGGLWQHTFLRSRANSIATRTNCSGVSVSPL